jgi:hypothetical protein
VNQPDVLVLRAQQSRVRREKRMTDRDFFLLAQAEARESLVLGMKYCDLKNALISSCDRARLLIYGQVGHTELNPSRQASAREIACASADEDLRTKPTNPLPHSSDLSLALSGICFRIIRVRLLGGFQAHP